MDNKSSNDTNNNQALRLANHSSNGHHTSRVVCAPPGGTSGVIDQAPGACVKQNGGRMPDSQTSDTDEDDTPRDVPSSYTPGGTTEAGSSQGSHSGGALNWCKICGKKCRRPGDIQRHLVEHLDRKPFKCADCGKRFQVKSNMLLHQRAAHGDRYNHEFLECPAGVSSGDMTLLCTETFPDKAANTSFSTAPRNITRCQVKGDVEMSEGHKDDSGSPASCKADSASPGPQSVHSSGDSDRLVEDEYSIEYPSVFPGLKHQLQVSNETVLVTRLDGLNNTTKEKLSLFKCHMCGHVFNYLSKLQCHLSLHFERTLNVYVCTYCDAHFQFKTQLTQHLRRSHEVQVTSKEDILDMTELVPAGDMEGSPADPTDQERGSKTLEANPVAPTPTLYSGFTSSDVTHVAGGKNSGSPPGGDSSGPGTAGTHPSSPLEYVQDGLQYSMATGALYSRVNGLYICQFCNKGFDRMFSLSRHERVHTGFKPCYCKYCGRGFSEPRNLRQHMIRFHADGQGRSMKRRRKSLAFGSPWRVNRRVSHSSQRLAYVPPELVARADHRRDDKQTTLQMTGPDTDSDQEARSPSDSVQNHQDQQQPHQKLEDSPKHMSQEPIIIQPMADSLEGSTNKELANEIREKEQLDEDICVVIPSGPHDTNKSEQERQTPKSVCSDNTNWSETISETESTNNEVIMSAPIKSLIGYHGQNKTRRKMSFTATTPTPGEDRLPAYSTPPDPDTDVKPKMEPPSDLPTSSLSSVYPSLDNPLTSAAVSAALTLPFNPLNISTYMTSGLGSLLPSPLISPLNQAAFFAQQGLTSPSMMSNPLSFFSPIPSPVAPPGVPTSMMPTLSSTVTPTGTPKEALSPMDQSPSPGSVHKAQSPSGSETNTPRGSLDDLQSWMSKGGGRGSALSRSHSSRLYVVRQPVKREDACKPVVLPDGRTVYRCTYCNKDFCTFSDVNRHMDFHEGGFGTSDGRHGPRHGPRHTRDSPAFLQDIRPYKCKFCDYYARTNSQLKVHMMRHQGIREFHCKLCNYKGVTQSDLNRHMKSQIHMMKAQNECKHCGEGFVSPKNLERHYHEKHFSQYEKMASSHAAAAAAVHASKLGQSAAFQGSV